ncbi:hypothetical protein Poly24_31780 [Rosistilla carotiformis]|uniref:Glycosyltransferase RgtA/B/C/D-like domain-containing protein n=1 Tax=Rosistilla carotiformis TaxID=2528017 RepID=A0A518JV90_9BACT|nr:glycosyltransferase family 39 protein [Rosistilla carotiformis]QDV69462.1 hypothetical protein Poly24_31780 [Rosistilla carotiformis]
MNSLRNKFESRSGGFHDKTLCVRYVWLIPVLLFVVLRLPALIHMPGGQDEHWFAVPGYTVWKEGIPRIPYVPTQNRDTFFKDADRCLFTLPPALFYLQAPFFAIFPAGYPTARIPLFLAALATIPLTFGLCKRLGTSDAAALLAATLMAIGRPLMFTGLVVRPDLLCAVCGWLCILMLTRFFADGRLSQLSISGLFCGLGALFHPFALVFAIQVGFAIVAMRSSIIDKAKQSLVFGLSTGATLLLWTPLIAMYPQEFENQFFANVVDRAGPGIGSRMLFPWDSLRHHAVLLFEFAGVWQCLLLASALVAGSVVILTTQPRRFAVPYLGLCWSSVYLTAVVAGIHPTKGYWVYPVFWIMGALALTVDWFAGTVHGDRNSQAAGDREVPGRKRRRIVYWISAVLLIGISLPGAGLTSSYRYVRYWGDPKYHAPTFIAQVLDDLPKEGLFLADLSYVFDVYLSGRETLLCQEREFYWGDQTIDYAVILLAWEGLDANWSEQYDAVLEKTYGTRERPQNCFVEVYRPQELLNE